MSSPAFLLVCWLVACLLVACYISKRASLGQLGDQPSNVLLLCWASMRMSLCWHRNALRCLLQLGSLSLCSLNMNLFVVPAASHCGSTGCSVGWQRHAAPGAIQVANSTPVCTADAGNRRMPSPVIKTVPRRSQTCVELDTNSLPSSASEVRRLPGRCASTHACLARPATREQPVAPPPHTAPLLQVTPLPDKLCTPIGAARTGSLPPCPPTAGADCLPQFHRHHVAAEGDHPAEPQPESLPVVAWLGCCMRQPLCCRTCHHQLLPGCRSGFNPLCICSTA